MKPYLMIALCCGLYAGLVAAVEPITVAWRDKAPYHYRENGIEQGFLLRRAKHIFALAEVPAVFVERPSKRIWRDFERGKSSYCSIGWYRLAERERIAQFSVPFHVDPPHMLLVSPGARATVQAHKGVATLLQDGRISVGVVDGVSYGPALDRLIAGSANQVERVTVAPASLMQMVAANRMDYMFADEADWEYLRRHEEGLDAIVEQRFADMPAGLERYIVCSKDVPAQVMTRINRAIGALSDAAPGD
ncbi:transporter substrate-binding domain-containing protein [Pseudomonas zhanjiangensis]|uniref:Transporter substrate-binding domain-containing protein n=1 Tax=Pseudomonas zhanjiangensis TaxID=3239015 RepID=A0ABV3YQY6_9PSED